MKKEIFEKYRWFFIMGLTILIILGGGIYWWGAQNKQKRVEDVFLQESTSESTIETTNGSYTLLVDIKGAVNSPGVYEIQDGDRMQDAIQLAGGLSKEADDRQINLSEKVADQQLIYIPKKGEKLTEQSQGQQQNNSEQTSEKVNLNTADKTQLQTLSGIGEKKAEEIINYREENGRFKTINDLTKVTGIGEKTVEKLKNSITI